MPSRFFEWIDALGNYFPDTSQDLAAWAQALATAVALWLTVRQARRAEQNGQMERIERMRSTASTLRAARMELDRLIEIDLGPSDGLEIAEAAFSDGVQYIDDLYLAFLDVPRRLVESADVSCLGSRSRSAVEQARAKLAGTLLRYRVDMTLDATSGLRYTQRQASRKLRKISADIEKAEHLIAEDARAMAHYSAPTANAASEPRDQ